MFRLEIPQTDLAVVDGFTDGDVGHAIKVYPPYPNSHLNLGVLADIYMGELSLALIQYREYMRLVGNNDKTVANWILELERRIKAGQQ